MANLRSGGFKGGVMAADTPESVAALPSAPDLAVVATPPTPDLLPALAAKGTFAAVVRVRRRRPVRPGSAVPACACWARNRSASRCPASG